MAILVELDVVCQCVAVSFTLCLCPFALLRSNETAKFGSTKGEPTNYNGHHNTPNPINGNNQYLPREESHTVLLYRSVAGVLQSVAAFVNSFESNSTAWSLQLQPDPIGVKEKKVEAELHIEIAYRHSYRFIGASFALFD